MSHYLIVNADDYGRTRRVSEAIRRAHKEGIVTSTTCMMNLPGIEHVLELALLECPALGLGVHLNLTAGMPLLPGAEVSTFVSTEGSFYRLNAFLANLETFDSKQALAEWRAQVGRFITVTGRKPDHLDSHHNSSYLTEGLFRGMLELAAELQVPIRPPFSGIPGTAQGSFPESVEAEAKVFVPALLEEFRPAMPEYMLTSFYDENATREELMRILEGLKQQPDGSCAEIMTHPGYYEEELRQVSSYNVQRERELGILVDPVVRECVRGLELVSYGQIKVNSRR